MLISIELKKENVLNLKTRKKQEKKGPKFPKAMPSQPCFLVTSYRN